MPCRMGSAVTESILRPDREKIVMGRRAFQPKEEYRPPKDRGESGLEGQ